MVNKNNNGNNDDGDNNNTSNSDFIEDHVSKMVNGIRTFLDPQYGNTTTAPKDEADAVVIAISSATKKYCELQIKILQTAPRDAVKLRAILQAKEKQYEIAQDSQDIERLVIEIDMLKYLLFLVNRRNVATEEEIRQ
jgi:hypothetical protein